MMAADRTYWRTKVPTHCQLTEEPITSEFVDGATRYGPWAIMSPKAHQRYGYGFGVGKGQLYQKQSDGRWLKTQG